MIASRVRLQRAVDLMAREYARIGPADALVLQPVAANYDAWFRDVAVPEIERSMTVDHGHYADDGNTNAIPNAGRIVHDGVSRYIVQPVVDWTLERFPAFWEAGLVLWRLNREMLMLPTPRKLAMTPADVDAVAGYQRAEISAWQDHAVRHRRHVERFVHTGMVQGWTREQFIRNMTAPDGHIVGFRYGNADISWHEHLRRYGVGRPHMMAAAAVEWRMRNAPNGRVP